MARSKLQRPRVRARILAAFTITGLAVTAPQLIPAPASADWPGATVQIKSLDPDHPNSCVALQGDNRLHLVPCVHPAPPRQRWRPLDVKALTTQLQNDFDKKCVYGNHLVRHELLGGQTCNNKKPGRMWEFAKPKVRAESSVCWTTSLTSRNSDLVEWASCSETDIRKEQLEWDVVAVTASG
ncbi:hypothetical protein [Nocardia sp. XZ_19_385]|uniref:hypothetical protein n=1 Tax=Nocardia sp. XZ_19_385 TaxID=2769488 RepID=UPI00188ED679|nr:hypothetical protein [Nocardia sp. XZ_19_385]